MNITNFPFRRLGELVRNMSLSGTFGNLCAWALLVLLSLIPVAVLVVLMQILQWAGMLISKKIDRRRKN